MTEIETLAQLDSLPVGAVVIDADGDAWQQRAHMSWAMAHEDGYAEDADELMRKFGPLRLVHTPDEGGA